MSTAIENKMNNTLKSGLKSTLSTAPAKKIEDENNKTKTSAENAAKLSQAPPTTPNTPNTNTPANTAPNPAKPVTATECARLINEAEDMIQALESVAAAYCAPSQECGIDVVCDDTLDGIKVKGSTIIAPSISPRGKEHAIMKSIAAALDYLSQRIDEKLNDFQNNNITTGVIADHIKNDSDPSKGKVIGRYIDPNGDEVLAYDSGLVDMTGSREAVQFVSELRENGTIPQIKQETNTSTFNPVQKTTGMKYFSDEEDDITKGVENPTPTENPVTPITNEQGENPVPIDASENPANDAEVNVADSIGESAYLVDMVSKMGNTRHLGYDLLTSQGFKNIKPVDFFSESAVDVSEIQHMKFDNTHIMKAVKCFNEARAEQSEAQGNHLDVKKLVNSKKWNEGIKELERQFDCHITLHMIYTDSGKEMSGWTDVVVNEHKQQCYVSKSKGFQLNGLPIEINIANSTLTAEAPSDQTLFGQATVSLFLHEIFHNIYAVMCTYNTTFNAMLTTTMFTATQTKSAKVRRKLMTNFVDAGEAMGVFKFNKIQKRLYIKKLLIISAMREKEANSKLAKSLIEEPDNAELVDKWINREEAGIKSEKDKIYGHTIEISSILTMAIAASIAIGGVQHSIGWLAAIGGLGLVAGYIGIKGAKFYKKPKQKAIADRETGKVRNFEEHWCDMFAAMYNLPVTFFPVPGVRVSPANMSADQIKRIHQIELAYVNMFEDEHPPTTERLASSVKYAKKTLDSGVKINPDAKRYLEWIIANNKQILEAEDIDTVFSKSTFDPKTAENLDLHLQNIITKANVPLTEQFIEDFISIE